MVDHYCVKSVFKAKPQHLQLTLDVCTKNKRKHTQVAKKTTTKD